MNIAIFTDFYAPSTGGTETAIEQQKASLEANGHNVTIVTSKYHTYSYDDTFIALKPLFAFRYGGHNHRIYMPTIRSIHHVTKQISDRNIDVIHVQTEFTVGMLALAVAKRTSLPLVYTSHTLLWRQADLGNAKLTNVLTGLLEIASYLLPIPSVKVKKIEKESFRSHRLRQLIAGYIKNADLVTTPSSHLKETLSSWQLSTPIIASPNFLSINPKIKKLPSIPTFLWIGRFDREKRSLVFAEAVEQLCNSTDIPFNVVMAGTGEHHRLVSEKLGKYTNVNVLGNLPHEDVSGVYANASLLVLTSVDFDNQPMTIAESVTHGRGVILQDKKIHDGLDNGAGLWTKDATSESLAKLMYDCIKDPLLIEKASNAAIRKAPLFSQKQGCNRLVEAYRTAINNKDGAQSKK